MTKKSEFYTLKGYQLKQKQKLTEAMEDYLEMIFRHTKEKDYITIKELSSYLNVLPSSASKMMKKLASKNLISFQKYGIVTLTEGGKQIGSYLLFRHDTLTNFFQMINQENFKLEQVEKIEHFIDEVTLYNLLKWQKSNKKIIK